MGGQGQWGQHQVGRATPAPRITHTGDCRGQRCTARPGPAATARARGGAPLRGYVTAGGAGPGAVRVRHRGVRCPCSVPPDCLTPGVGGRCGGVWLVLPSLFCTPILSLHPAVAVLQPRRVLYPEFVLHHEVIVLHRRFLVLHPGLPLQSGLFCSAPRVCFVLFVLHPRAVLHPEVVVLYPGFVLHSGIVVLYPGFVLHSAVVVLQPQGVFCALSWFCTPGLLCAQVFVSPPGVFFYARVVFPLSFLLFVTPVSVCFAPSFLLCTPVF